MGEMLSNGAAMETAYQDIVRAAYVLEEVRRRLWNLGLKELEREVDIAIKKLESSKKNLRSVRWTEA
jgi:hypothetical protein